ncbi:MAG: PD40 domain-containing protein [Candidatus Zixiibacteriota bacterium]|nr:MAG: PD40 domain-containing protein [candidate division Zixibacteria bacterium]
MYIRWFCLVLLLPSVFTVGSMTGDGGTGDQQEKKTPGWTVVFSSNEDGVGFEIYSMAADGSDVRRLTDSRGHNMWPSLSPDGKRIAFSSDRDGNAGICLMEIDGTNVTRLTNNDLRAREPTWSPDGKQIVFESWQEAESQIRVINADGGGERIISAFPGDKHSPCWSPDGRLIAFHMEDGGQSGIYVMNPDGSEPKLLATAESGLSPRLHPPVSH